MTTDLQTTRNGASADLAPSAAAIESFALLDAIAGGEVQEAPRLDALATISAGQKVTKDGKTFPTRSRDGTIFLHDPEGRAPGLKAALEAAEYKRLTIAFPFDDPRAFIQQRFALYAATKLAIYGDERSIRVITDRGMETFEAGTPEYITAAQRCKVSVSVYFTLAEWTPSGPQVVLSDGLALYRLRFTSRNSLRSIVGSIKQVAHFTRGRLAGIPFDLVLVNRDTSDGTGTRRDICVWTIVMRPPGEMRLTSKNAAEMLRSGLAQGAALMLPPASETLELAALEGPDLDLDAPSEAEAELLARGGPCDRRHWAAQWHVLAQDTRLDDAEARAGFIEFYSTTSGWPGGTTRSLGDFLARASEAEAAALIEALRDSLARDTRARAQRAPDRAARIALQQAYLGLLEAPLDRDVFLEFAYELDPTLREKADVAKALGVPFLDNWDASGRSWESALAVLHQRAVAPPSAPAVEVIAPQAHDRAADPDDFDGVVDDDDQADANDFDALLAEDARERDSARDPMAAVAQETIEGLRKLAAAAAEGHSPTEKSNLGQRRELSAALRRMGLTDTEDRASLVRAVFGCEPEKLGFFQAHTLTQWAQQDRNRSAAAAIVAVAGGQRSLIGA